MLLIISFALTKFSIQTILNIKCFLHWTRANILYNIVIAFKIAKI